MNSSLRAGALTYLKPPVPCSALSPELAMCMSLSRRAQAVPSHQTSSLTQTSKSEHRALLSTVGCSLFETPPRRPSRAALVLAHQPRPKSPRLVEASCGGKTHATEHSRCATRGYISCRMPVLCPRGCLGGCLSCWVPLVLGASRVGCLSYAHSHSPSSSLPPLRPPRLRPCGLGAPCCCR